MLRRGKETNHHKRVHLGIKDVKCDSCKKTFTHKHDLLIHVEAFHEPWSFYKCNSCEKHFNNKKSITQHLKNVHKKPMDRVSLLKLTKKSSTSTADFKYEIQQNKVGK